MMNNKKSIEQMKREVEGLIIQLADYDCGVEAWCEECPMWDLCHEFYILSLKVRGVIE